MNVILILIDSLNKAMLEPYGGGPPGVTPNLLRLAAAAVRFDGHFVGSLPCMPARREIFAGRQDFLWRPWGHLEPFDTSLPQLAARRGRKTMLVTDHYHYWEHGAHGYLESFAGVEMIRGHEVDPWRTDWPTDDADLPPWVRAIERYRPGSGRRYYANVRDFADERDFFPAKVFTAAGDWLGRNYGRGEFFLQVESFDVHEPFHVPEPYRSMWTEHARDDFNCWPPYQVAAEQARFFDDTSPEELAFIRGQYLGKLTMVDRWLGKLLDRLDALGAWADTAVVLTTDHGHDLGERRAFGKQFPHFDGHANIPLIVYHPALAHRAGDGIDALTQTVDLNPTLAELMGLDGHAAPHGRSLVPLLDGRASVVRDSALYGTFATGACVTDGRHALIQGYDNRHPLFLYSTRMPHVPASAGSVECGSFLPGVAVPVWRMPAEAGGSHPSLLIDRASGTASGTATDADGADPATLRRMRDLLGRALREAGTPPEQFARLGLPA